MTYGETLKLDDQMDIVVDELKRIPLVTDLDKVQQDLKVLFRTFLGDDIFHTTYGLDFITIDELGTVEVKRREIQAAAMKYKYTKRVILIDITQDQVGGAWIETWKVTLLLLSGEEITVEVSP
jgi:hypothetical protein